MDVANIGLLVHESSVNSRIAFQKAAEYDVVRKEMAEHAMVDGAPSYLGGQDGWVAIHACADAGKGDAVKLILLSKS